MGSGKYHHADTISAEASSRTVSETVGVDRPCGESDTGARLDTDDHLMGVSDQFSHNMNHLIENFFAGNHPRYCPIERAWNPPTDIYEASDALYIKMEVAGLEERDLEVKVSDNHLIIRGRRVDQCQMKRECFHQLEIQYGYFERIFRLPTQVRTDEVAAALRNGFLLVSVPKITNDRELRIYIE